MTGDFSHGIFGAASRPRVMLDLFCGLGGASSAMRARGWHVVGVDNRPELEPDILTDLAAWRWDGGPVDLLWASPPCTEFARADKRCWYPDAPAPSCALLATALRLVMEIRPRFWLVENVRGAKPYFESVLSPPAVSCPPMYLWGRPPRGFVQRLPGALPHKDHQSRRSDDPRAQRLSSDDRRRQLRAVIPSCVSEALALCCEAELSRTPSEQLRLDLTDAARAV